MKRIDESHWQCPKCNGIFAIGELQARKKSSYGHKAGELLFYCRQCQRSISKKSARAKQVKQLIASGDAARAEARRKLEILREERELAQLEAA